jgi:Tfp pilus assembly protein PilF
VRFRDIISADSISAPELIKWIFQAQEKNDPLNKMAWHDLFITLGTKLGFSVEYGSYSRLSKDPFYFDGLWNNATSTFGLLIFPEKIESFDLEALKNGYEDFFNRFEIPLDEFTCLVVTGAGASRKAEKQLSSWVATGRLRPVKVTTILELLSMYEASIINPVEICKILGSGKLMYAEDLMAYINSFITPGTVLKKPAPNPIDTLPGTGTAIDLDSSPTYSPEPVNDAPPVYNPEPVNEAPPVYNPEPVNEAPPVYNPEPVNEAPLVYAPEAIVEAPPVYAPEPTVEAPPSFAPEPTVEAPPSFAPEPTVEAPPSFAPDPYPAESLFTPEPPVQETPATVIPPYEPEIIEIPETQMESDFNNEPVQSFAEANQDDEIIDLVDDDEEEILLQTNVQAGSAPGLTLKDRAITPGASIMDRLEHTTNATPLDDDEVVVIEETDDRGENSVSSRLAALDSLGGLPASTPGMRPVSSPGIISPSPSPIDRLNESMPEPTAHQNEIVEDLHTMEDDTSTSELDSDIMALIKVTAENPTNLAAHIQLGKLYTQKCEYDKAIAAIKKVINAESDNVQANMVLGEIHFKKQEFPKAALSYDVVLNKSPNNTQALLRLGRVYLEQEKLSRALKTLQKAEESTDIPNAEIQLEIAKVYYLEGQPDKSLIHLEKAKAADPSNIQVHVAMGHYYLDVKKPSEAKKVFEEGLKLDPGNIKLQTYVNNLQ